MNIERIEALVKKHLDRDGWSLAPDGEVASAIRNALTEQAETHLGELRERDERIRQLEADKAEYDRRIVAVGGVAINSVSREYHDAEVARLNALYESAVKGRQDFREAYRSQLEAERVPEGYVLVQQSIHPLDCDNGDKVIQLLANTPDAGPFDNPQDFYQFWWQQLLFAAAPQPKKEGE